MKAFTDVKPWQKLGVSRKQYTAAKPWKKAGIKREIFEEMIVAIPDHLLQEMKREREAQELVDILFGNEK